MIFVVLVERQVRTIPTKLQSESSEQLCIYIYMDLEKFKYKVVEYRRFPIQISLELLAYYNYGRGNNTTNQGHQLCFSLM